MGAKRGSPGMAKRHTPLTVSHRHRLVQELRQDPELARHYLKAAARDPDERVYRAAVRTVAQAEVLTFSALLTLLGRRSRQSIYDLMRRDATFPRPRQMGSEFSIGWLRGEVMNWLTARPRAELNGLDAVERRRRARKTAGVSPKRVKPPR